MTQTKLRPLSDKQLITLIKKMKEYNNIFTVDITHAPEDLEISRNTPNAKAYAVGYSFGFGNGLKVQKLDDDRKRLKDMTEIANLKYELQHKKDIIKQYRKEHNKKPFTPV